MLIKLSCNEKKYKNPFPSDCRSHRLAAHIPMLDALGNAPLQPVTNHVHDAPHVQQPYPCHHGPQLYTVPPPYNPQFMQHYPQMPHPQHGQLRWQLMQHYAPLQHYLPPPPHRQQGQPLVPFVQHYAPGQPVQQGQPPMPLYHHHFQQFVNKPLPGEENVPPQNPTGCVPPQNPTDRVLAAPVPSKTQPNIEPHPRGTMHHLIESRLQTDHYTVYSFQVDIIAGDANRMTPPPPPAPPPHCPCHTMAHTNRAQPARFF